MIKPVVATLRMSDPTLTLIHEVMSSKVIATAWLRSSVRCFTLQILSVSVYERSGVNFQLSITALLSKAVRNYYKFISNVFLTFAFFRLHLP